MDNKFLISVIGRGQAACPSGETILASLLASGVDYPHGCETGLCSLCKSRLVAGEVKHGEYFESALSDSDRKAGLFLPCTSKALSDCVIAPVQHDAFLPPVRTISSSVAEVRRLTHDTSLVVVKQPIGVPFEFLPGQYAQLDLAGNGARDFSMANLPNEDVIAFIIRTVSGGRVTEKVIPRLQAGTPLTLKGPMGNAYLRESHVGPILLVGGGSGLSPVLSIARAAAQRGMRQAIKLYFGVRTRADVFFEHILRQLAEENPNIEVHLVLSNDSGDSAGYRSGFLHEVIQADLAGHALRSWEAYVAGPPPMVDAVSALVKKLGLPESKCHADPFVTAAQVELTTN